jgi:hypothetical protein
MFIKLNTLLYKLKRTQNNTLLKKFFIKVFYIKLSEINRFKAILPLNN